MVKLEQTKLTKDEWLSIEVPISEYEMKIVELINNSNKDIINYTSTFINALKIKFDKQLEYYIYDIYFKKDIDNILKKHNENIKLQKVKINTLKKADKIRLDNLNKRLNDSVKENIFEYKIIFFIDKFYHYYSKKSTKWYTYYYTITEILKQHIVNINLYIIEILKIIKEKYKDDIKKIEFLKNSVDIIEQNKFVSSFKDIKLYSHQKDLFNVFKNTNSKLVLYTAPTGTGKTITPIGLLSKYKVIFVCAARHIGLSLVRSAISIKKKIAVGFGCDNMDEIKLHYSAAKDYIVNKNGYKKVDNTNGENVELIICDIKSYIHVMNYMLKFNKKDELVLFWDEPTISMDYEKHDLHQYISNAWSENKISNIILSSATLPKRESLTSMICDYKNKFPDGIVYTIHSNELTNNVSLINKDGYVVAIHELFDDYKKVQDVREHLINNFNIVKYLDLSKIIDFITYVCENKLFKNTSNNIENYFDLYDLININSIKGYYLDLLKDIEEEKWFDIYNYFLKKQRKKYKSTIYLTSKDAHTITDGPCLYLTDDVKKISKFCIQEVKIIPNTIREITENVNYNNKLTEKINIVKNNLEDVVGKFKKDEIKSLNDIPGANKLQEEIMNLEQQLKKISISDIYIPNKKSHIDKWCDVKPTDTFTSNVSNRYIEKILLIQDLDNMYKLLLIMGIGVFSENMNKEYIEIMKELAIEQKLFLIIATSDYIYGTNYQFCHCYIGKDLNITQEKIIQSIGRVGRNNNQKSYSIRIRDNNIINKLLEEDIENIEAKNMNLLFKTC